MVESIENIHKKKTFETFIEQTVLGLRKLSFEEAILISFQL